jgi:hypothetical protein
MTCRVVDELGAPVTASVYIVDSPVPVPDLAQITDERGRCMMTLPVQGHYRVGARATNGDIAERDIDVTENSFALDLQVGRF